MHASLDAFVEVDQSVRMNEPERGPEPTRTDLPDADPPARIGVAAVAAAGALVVAGAPLVPSILWYTGDTLFDTSSRDLTFVEAAWMLLSHEHDVMWGVVLFLAPSLAAAAALLLRSQVGAKALWRRLSLISVLVAAFELILVQFRAEYGTVYDAVAGFFGIQSMIPEERFLTHALILLGGSALWAVGEELRARRDAATRPAA